MGIAKKYAPSSSNSVCRLKVSCVVYVAQLLLRVLISASCLWHLAFRFPVTGLGRLRTARRYPARPPGFRPSATVTSIISAMAKKKSPADRLRARARKVRHDASYGGIFEMCVWGSMRKTALFLAYDVTVINALAFSGCGGCQMRG